MFSIYEKEHRKLFEKFIHPLEGKKDLIFRGTNNCFTGAWSRDNED